MPPPRFSPPSSQESSLLLCQPVNSAPSAQSFLAEMTSGFNSFVMSRDEKELKLESKIENLENQLRMMKERGERGVFVSVFS